MDTEIASMVRAFESPEGLALLKATDELLRGPRAPTRSGYWFGYLTGEKIDPKLRGRRRPGIFAENRD